MLDSNTGEDSLRDDNSNLLMLRKLNNLEVDKDLINMDTIVNNKERLPVPAPSVLVLILQCETKSCDKNIDNLRSLFSNPYFIVQVCTISIPNNIIVSKTLNKKQAIENYSFLKALNYAAEGPYEINDKKDLQPKYNWSEMPVIIIKDSSVSNIDPRNNLTGMNYRIEVALNKAKTSDLFFLCKWNDECSKYKDIEGSYSGSSLKWSMKPTATQAIMYTPRARDYIRNILVDSNIPLSDLLNTNISQGKLLATVFVPNIVDFDINLATSNRDFLKLNECAPPPVATQKNTRTSFFILFTIIIIILIAMVWAVISFIPR